METLVQTAIRATLMIGAVGGTLQILRVASPRLVHRVWVGVVVVMLLLPALVAWGPRLMLPVLGAQSYAVTLGDTASAVVSRVARLPVAPLAPVPVPPARSIDWWNVALGIYLLGVLAMLLRVADSARRARLFARGITLLHGRLTHSLCVAPLTTGLMTPVVVLPPDWPEWSSAELALIVAHEAEHVRHRDPLMSLITLINRAIFWCHPLAWWLHRHTSALAEQACDDAVIAAGHDPDDYLHCLLRFARRVAETRHRIGALTMAMPGGELSARVGRIEAGRTPSMSGVRRVCVVAACASCILAFAVTTPVETQGVNQAFEVASVKPNQSRSPVGLIEMRPRRGAAFVATNVTLRDLIRVAYGLQMAQIAGGPDWLAADRFDINAKAAADARPSPLMLQRLLAERFGLTIRRETRELPAYALEVGRADRAIGRNLHPSQIDCQALLDGSAETRPVPGNRQDCDAFNGAAPRMVGGGVTMRQLADSLARQVHTVVVDRTRLAGGYDFELQWRPEFVEAPPPGVVQTGPPRLNGVDVDPNWPELFTALREQLGLELESKREAVPVVVVESASRPMPN